MKIHVPTAGPYINIDRSGILKYMHPQRFFVRFIVLFVKKIRIDSLQSILRNDDTLIKKFFFFLTHVFFVIPVFIHLMI